MNIEIVDRMNQIEIQEQEIARRQCELASRVKAPADAEKYKSEIIMDSVGPCMKEICRGLDFEDAGLFPISYH